MEGTDWGQLVLLGNDVAMQWYSMTQDKPIPTPQIIPGTGIPTATYQQTTQLLIVGLVVVAAVMLLGRK